MACCFFDHRGLGYTVYAFERFVEELAMTKTAIRKGLRELPMEDRAEILDELVHLIAADQHELTLPGWQKKLLDRRFEQYETNPKKVITASEFQKSLREKVKRMRTAAKTKRTDK